MPASVRCAEAGRGAILADALTEQIAAELQQIQFVVSDLLKLKSQWSGVVDLVELSLEANGKKRYDCSIEITRATANKESRWRVLIHEMIHAHSVGLARESYDRYRGWEEGVVEHLQRQLRPTVLERLGVTVAPEVFAAEEATFAFAPYLDELEALRLALILTDLSAREFYRELLSHPLPFRAKVADDFVMRLPQDQQRSVKRRLLIAHLRLCHPV